jgi:hypothetical protein
MNQLINVDNMSLEQMKQFEMQITQKKMELLREDIEKLSAKSDHHDFKIKEIDNKTDYLKENMILDSRGIKKIHTAGQQKVIKVLGGKDSPAYKELSMIVFKNFWVHYCHRMGRITCLKDTRAEDFNKAMEHIEKWAPTNFQTEIDMLNNQFKMDI